MCAHARRLPKITFDDPQRRKAKNAALKERQPPGVNCSVRDGSERRQREQTKENRTIEKIRDTFTDILVQVRTDELNGRFAAQSLYLRNSDVLLIWSTATSMQHLLRLLSASLRVLVSCFLLEHAGVSF